MYRVEPVGALGPLVRDRGAEVLRAALPVSRVSWAMIGLAVAALAATGCRPAKGGPATANDPAAAISDGASPPLSAQVGPEAAAPEDDELSEAGDDFAALAYALHGLDEHGHPAQDDEHDHEGDDHEGEDHEGDDQTPSTWNPPTAPAKSPLADLSADEIKRRLKDDPASLGSISIGATNRGALFNGVQVPAGDHWTMTDPGNAYGTAESVEQLLACIEAVNEKHPKTQKMIIGHFSARRGGRLKPHKSHQAGRDVDVSYYYVGDRAWYARADAKNLDRARTWTFVKALLTKADVEMILIDTSIQRLLRDYAIAAGEERQFVDRVFQVSGRRTTSAGHPHPGFAPIRHAPGHATHIHVRFRSPVAVASGQVAAAYLPRPKEPTRERGSAKHGVAHHDDKPGTGKNGGPAKSKPSGKGAPPKEPKEDEPRYVMHRARSGDTLDALARRYGTTVQAIREANGLKGNALKMKHTYKIRSRSPRAARDPQARRPSARADAAGERRLCGASSPDETPRRRGRRARLERVLPGLAGADRGARDPRRARERLRVRRARLRADATRERRGPLVAGLARRRAPSRRRGEGPARARSHRVDAAPSVRSRAVDPRRLPGSPAADRSWTDDLAADDRRDDDRGARAHGEGARPRDRHGLGVPGRGPREARARRLLDRDHPRAR
jgi:murein endopeptidase/LysM repeat protein